MTGCGLPADGKMNTATRKLSASEVRKRRRAGAYHDGRQTLSAKKIAKLTAEGRYHDALVPGLYLQVTKTNNGGTARSWLLRYELNGRERMMGLGSAAIFNLAEARQRARAARQQLADGIDPLVQRHAARAAAVAAAAKRLSFRQAAEQYFNRHQSEWHNTAHGEQFLASLRNYVFPALGNLDVAVIDTPDVLRAVEPIWLTKTATATRVRQRIEQILDFAVVSSHRQPGANPARWKGHLDQVLAKPNKIAPVEHHRAIDYRELPPFIMNLREREGVAARALEFLILTAARTGEVIGAKWDEINLNDATWTVPPARMKAKREHRVPLAPAAIVLLHRLPREADNPFVFIGPQAARGFSDMALTRVLQRMGRNETVHGFRSAFSDWAHEQTAHANHTIELSLAHLVGSEVERAYRRKDMLAKRAKLMADWAKYVASKPVSKAYNIVAIGRPR
jgi:integrase